MKILKYVMTFSVLILLGSACKDDPRNTEELIDPWLRERTPISFKLQGQVGEATIVDDWRNDGEGTITITMISTAVEDLHNVEVLDLDLQYNATSSVSVGSVLDMTEGSDSFIITAENGETRTYEVSFEEFQEPIVGVYEIDQLWLYGGTGPEYGGGAVWNLMEKSWRWNVDGKPTAEEDNTITLVLKGVDEETGDTYGTCLNDAGPDGMYASFIYDDRDWVKHDLKHFYRCIPEGESTWEKDSETGVITFISSEGVQRSCTILDAGDHDLDEYKSISIENLGFNFPITEGVSDNWDVIWEDDAKYLWHPRNFIVKATKQ
ncbi:hypothetical protein ACUNWD_03135 [Sunxiuqinia sp. A32]|uniref:hypothetical protein n=1 Tax=Sunxiuqinia sp. A32 TaxID=3461496 RepID=UPI004045625E